MGKFVWVRAPLGIEGNLASWKSFMDNKYPNPIVGNVYLITYESGDRVGYEFKGQHPISGDKWWERVKEEFIESYFDQWLNDAVMGRDDSVLAGMTQALNPEIRESLESLYDEGFDDVILADFAHQMSKR